MDRGPSVLLVEDGWTNRDALRDLLKYEGHPVSAVVDGAAALERFHGGARPSLTLLDLDLPRVDGPEFRRRPLADPSLARIP